MNLRELARGKPCMVRLPGCDGGGETTCLAHYSLVGISGRGFKSPDTVAAWCCAKCHAIVDGRDSVPMSMVLRQPTRDEIRLAHAEGVMRTLAELERLGFTLTRGK